MDTQVIEILGRNRLVNELLQAGLEVARPERDRGIDLFAYADLSPTVQSFIARPIQMKAASGQGFSLATKYRRLPDLILAYVWHLATPAQAITYALTYDEALAIAEALPWTKTESWAQGQYATSHPSQQLLTLLEPYAMTPARWWTKVTSLPQEERAT
ncbi:MAG TPA: hypothetical protein VKT82_03285 [Ktedonobacterales bacterium]|nr:hypothetical protein [Ktedonobacterales bacterium]